MESALPRPVAYLATLLLVAGVVAMIWSALRVGPGGKAGEKRPAAVDVVLDPGHGGVDGGTVMFGLREKDLVLDLGLRLERELQTRGLRVAMTRRADVSVSLTERVELARKHPEALFVSLHLNRFSSKRVRGVEAYVTTPEKPVLLRLEPGDRGREYRDGRSTELGLRLVRGLGERMEMPVRGVREARFVVTRDMPQPAVLLECGYLSNPQDAYLMAQADNRQKMAEALADACKAYLADAADNRLLGYTAWSDDAAGESSVGPDPVDGMDEAP